MHHMIHNNNITLFLGGSTVLICDLEKGMLMIMTTLHHDYIISIENVKTNSSSFYTTGGGAVTDLRAVQTGPDTVLVTWTAPSPAPPRGYQVMASGNNNATVIRSPHIFILTQPGNYTIVVEPLSRHFPSEAASVLVTVTGIHIHNTRRCNLDDNFMKQHQQQFSQTQLYRP